MFCNRKRVTGLSKVFYRYFSSFCVLASLQGHYTVAREAWPKKMFSLGVEIENVTRLYNIVGPFCRRRVTARRITSPLPDPHVLKSASRMVLSRTQLTPHVTRRAPHGASRLVQAMCAWPVNTRHAPSRPCRDANVYGCKTTSMHNTEYPLIPTPDTLPAS